MVVLGYTDPGLIDVAGDSPTLALRTRFILLTIAAASGWTLFKGDIKNAFLQGDKVEAE